MTHEQAYDTVDTLRLRKHNQNVSAIPDESQSAVTSSSSTSDLCDLDIDALDKEFKSLQLEFQKNMSALREDPTNSSLKQSVMQTKEKLQQLKLWSTKLNTEEGRHLLEQRRKDEEKRKYEIDQVLKLIKAQSAVDICFMMDCTGSMIPYIESAKKNINNLTQTIKAMCNTTPRLAFVGYRDIDHKQDNLIQLDFTSDTDAFRNFLSNIRMIGGVDYCEDVIGKKNFPSHCCFFENIHLTTPFYHKFNFILLSLI